MPRRRRKQKRNSFRLAKQQLGTCIMFFCTVSLPSLHVYDVKPRNFTLCGGWEHKTTIFFFFCEVRYSHLEFNSWKNHQPMKNEKSWNKSDESWNIRNPIFGWSFRRCRRHFLRSLKSRRIGSNKNKYSNKYRKSTQLKRFKLLMTLNWNQWWIIFWSVLYQPIFARTSPNKIRQLRTVCTSKSKSLQWAHFFLIC